MPYARKKDTQKTVTVPRKAAGVTKRKYKKRQIFRPQSLLSVGFPKTTMVKLRYVDGSSINPTVGTISYIDFVANDLNDPNGAIGGHQPMNYDQWMLLYNHYMVVGSKVTAQFHIPTTSADGGYLCGINLQDDTTMSTDPTTVMEQALTTFKLGTHSSTSYSGIGPKVTKTFSCKKFFNITNPLDNVSRFGGQAGAAPNDKAHFLIFYGAAPGNNADLPAVNITVVIDYIVVFSEPKEQPKS